MRTVFGFATLALMVLAAAPVLAQEHEHGGGGDAVSAVGVVNSVDAAGRKVNVTHEPIPDLGWPSMTMDMSLSDNASLEGIEEGAAIMFTLKKGADGIYQIDSIMPAGDHSMKPAPAGDWAYAGRDNPPAPTGGHLALLPVAGTRGAEWVVTQDGNAAARCKALLNNPQVMVDRATRALCAGAS